ncbi:MAG: hypothetical protein OXK72_09150, partial [Gammaproteobacteria bacterium]|nr:hypothetical protein [Gammaproteobacteria bacterium]
DLVEVPVLGRVLVPVMVMVMGMATATGIVPVNYLMKSTPLAVTPGCLSLNRESFSGQEQAILLITGASGRVEEAKPCSESEFMMTTTEFYRTHCKPKAHLQA